MPRASTAAWLDDVRAGTAAAVVSIGTLLPLGLLAVAALGPAAAGAGLRATFVSAIVGAAVACVVGGARVPFYQPRTSVTLIHAGLVAALAADPALVRDGAPDVALILAVAGVAVMLSGVLQVAFGAFRVGSLAKFVPMPVIAGFMDGVAILIALAQVPLLLGVGTWHAARELGTTTSPLFPAEAGCQTRTTFPPSTRLSSAAPVSAPAISMTTASSTTPISSSSPPRTTSSIALIRACRRAAPQISTATASSTMPTS